jgi:hypothetical protein
LINKLQQIPSLYLASHRTSYFSKLGPSCSMTVYCLFMVWIFRAFN